MTTATRLRALLLAVVVLSLGCSRRDQSSLKLGAILSLTGPAAAYGQDNLKGLTIAQRLTNSLGGIHGKQLSLEVEDSAGDPAQAVALGRRFASDPDIVAIVGPTRTGCTVAVARLLPLLKLPMMSVGSTGDWPAAEGRFNDWTFRSTRVDSYLVGPLLAAARDRFGIKTIGIIYTANDDWSASVLKVYTRVAHDLGIPVTSVKGQMTGDIDRSVQLTDILTTKPDGLVINTLASDAPLIAAEARRLGFTGRFIGTAGFTNPQTWNLADPGVLEGTLLADNFFAGSSRPAVQRFVAQYRKAYSAEPPAYAAYAYDGLLLVAEAARRAHDPHDRAQLRNELAGIAGFDGALGKLTYHGSGDAQKEPLVLMISHGRYSLIQG